MLTPNRIDSPKSDDRYPDRCKGFVTCIPTIDLNVPSFIFQNYSRGRTSNPVE
jgi:hypothetical protein